MATALIPALFPVKDNQNIELLCSNSCLRGSSIALIHSLVQFLNGRGCSAAAAYEL
jgi:hypothetical protein